MAYGLCEVFILSRIGEEIAFIVNLKSFESAVCLFIGFDEKYKNFSPGKILMAECIKETLDAGTPLYDFLYGDGEYKRFWANRTKLIQRCVSWRGWKAWVLGLILYRLHGILSRSEMARNALSKIRRIKMHLIGWK